MKLIHILENRASQVKSYDKELGKILLDVRKTSKHEFNGGTTYSHEGKLHRNDGKPAVVRHCGIKLWIIRGKYHREDGPAVIGDGGKEKWFLNGDQYTEEEWKKKLDKK